MNTSGLMEKLKDSTRAMHDAAESSQFQGKLAQGALPLKLYADYLEQLYLMHSHLENEINKHADKFAHVVSEQQLQEPFLRKDLKGLGRQINELKPISATSKMLASISSLSSSCPAALLGMHYVLLGSKHGGKFIAKSCQDAYSLGETGTCYFDPYGPSFMPLWKSFKESMNELPLNENEVERTCAAASEMFKGVAAIGDELMPTQAVH